MNVTSYLQQREMGVSTRNDFQAKDALIALLEEQAATPITNQACKLQGQPRATFLMDFSLDGTQVASTHGDHTVRVSNTVTGKCTHVLTGHPRTPWCVGFHPSYNDILASGCLGGEVRIWDLLGGGSEVWHSPSNGVIASLSFHPMDHVLVFATGNTIYFWDWSRPEPFAFSKTSYDFERIRWVRFDPLGHFLYTGIANNTTVHRQEPSNIVHINESQGHRPNRMQQFANRRRYQQVIQHFHDYQEERGRSSSTTRPESTISESSENQLEDPPPSPVHEESLDYARQYAHHVTNMSNQSAQQARPFVPSASQPALHRPPHVQGPLTFNCPRSARWNSLPRGTWSPPPQEAAVDEDDSIAGEELSIPEPSLNSVGGNNRTDVPSSGSGRVSLFNPRPLMTARSMRTVGPLTSQFFTNIRSRISESRDSRNVPPSTTSSGIHWISSIHRSDNSNRCPQVGASGPQSATVGSDSSLRSVAGSNVTGSQERHNLALSDSSGITDNRQNVLPLTSGTGALGRPQNTIVTRLLNLRSQCRNSSSSSSSTCTSVSQRPHFSLGSHAPIRPRPHESAFREVPPSNTARHSCSTHSTESASVHTSCEMCRTFNLRLLDSWSSTSTTPTTSNSGIRVSWAANTVSSCSSRPHILSSRPYMFSRHRRLLALNQARDNPYPRTSWTRTSDGTSQTSGAMVLPSCADQGTDVAGLSEPVVIPVLSDTDTVDSVQIDEADVSDSPVARTADSDLQLPCGTAPSETPETCVTVCNTDSSSSLQTRSESLTNLTMRLERQVSELDRRISVLRENFTERLRALHQDRERILSQIFQPPQPQLPPTSGQPSQHVPLITITRPQDHGNFSHTHTAYDNSTNSNNQNVQNPHLLEMFLRGDGRPPVPCSISRHRSRPSRVEPHEERSWHALQQRHLHPHYSVSILDETINRPNDALQAAINRAIAGAFMGTGEPAVASNIIPQTHRIQRWDFTRCEIPDITHAKQNIVVSHCKLHNDASCDISQDGSFLATFVPSHRGFPDDNILAVFSLHSESFGQCLFTKSFGPNAISVSLSPHNQCVMVGLASKRLSWVFTSNQLVAQVYKLAEKNAGENSMKHLCDVFHPCDTDVRTHVSINSARWLRGPGEGLVYGTNRGDLHICRPGSSVRRNLMTRVDSRSTIATQTISRGIRRTTETQTDRQTDDTRENEIMV
ncbi:activating molecule in BECN1-regulated autophagy protein 1-like [Gigantopelta aegis]|uniref:activating molecule in BECN1-regulated autophagy protein 1-like n=1 Tax=Gigantopelta aegis TaxID=1735272 RepID=UPI001B8893B3|nr:activating molecule in BECN1-regulated autophagy protein 1-like [Gigantopelta aegis]